MGHYASDCTAEESEEKQDEPGQSGTQLLMAAAASGDLSNDEGFGDYNGLFFLNKGVADMSYKEALMRDQKIPRSGTSEKKVTFKEEPNCLGSVSYEHILSQTRDRKVDPNWILLDNQSTHH
jgi:hypothetical protein